MAIQSASCGLSSSFPDKICGQRIEIERLKKMNAAADASSMRALEEELEKLQELKQAQV